VCRQACSSQPRQVIGHEDIVDGRRPDSCCRRWRLQVPGGPLDHTAASLYHQLVDSCCCCLDGFSSLGWLQLRLLCCCILCCCHQLPTPGAEQAHAPRLTQAPHQPHCHIQQTAAKRSTPWTSSAARRHFPTRCPGPGPTCPACCTGRHGLWPRCTSNREIRHCLEQHQRLLLPGALAVGRQEPQLVAAAAASFSPLQDGGLHCVEARLTGQQVHRQKPQLWGIGVQGIPLKHNVAGLHQHICLLLH